MLKRFDVCKIPGDMNSADVVTKAMSATEMRDKIESVGGFFVENSGVASVLESSRLSWADALDEEQIWK